MLRRVFVDANVLIAGADSRSGASHAVLKLAELGLIQLATSRQVLDKRDFTPAVAAASGLVIQTPGQFVQDVRALLSEGLAED